MLRPKRIPGKPRIFLAAETGGVGKGGSKRPVRRAAKLSPTKLQQIEKRIALLKEFAELLNQKEKLVKQMETSNRPDLKEITAVLDRMTAIDKMLFPDVRVPHASIPSLIEDLESKLVYRKPKKPQK